MRFSGIESLRRETGPLDDSDAVDASSSAFMGVSLLAFLDVRGGADRVLCLDGLDIDTRVDCVRDLDERVFRGDTGANRTFFSSSASSSSSLMPILRFSDLTGDALGVAPGEWMNLSKLPLNDRGASSSSILLSCRLVIILYYYLESCKPPAAGLVCVFMDLTQDAAQKCVVQYELVQHIAQRASSQASRRCRSKTSRKEI